MVPIVSTPSIHRTDDSAPRETNRGRHAAILRRVREVQRDLSRPLRRRATGRRGSGREVT